MRERTITSATRAGQDGTQGATRVSGPQSQSSPGDT